MDNVGNVILYTNVVFGWWLVLRTVQQHCVWFWYEWIRYSSVGGLNTVLNIYCSLLHSPPLEVYRLIFFFSMHIVYVCVRVCVKVINLCPILSQNWKVCFFFLVWWNVSQSSGDTEMFNNTNTAHFCIERQTVQNDAWAAACYCTPTRRLATPVKIGNIAMYGRKDTPISNCSRFYREVKQNKNNDLLHNRLLE